MGFSLSVQRLLDGMQMPVLSYLNPGLEWRPEMKQRIGNGSFGNLGFV